jgi:hypothetical protein
MEQDNIEDYQQSGMMNINPENVVEFRKRFNSQTNHDNNPYKEFLMQCTSTVIEIDTTVYGGDNQSM